MSSGHLSLCSSWVWCECVDGLVSALEEFEKTSGGASAKSSVETDHKVRELEQQVGA